MSLPMPEPRPDVIWRPLHESDAEALLDLVLASERADDAPFVSSPAEIERQMAILDADLATDSVVAVTPDGRLAAFGVARMRASVNRRRPVGQDGAVRPEMRRRGLGDAVLSWTEARGLQRLAEADDDLPRFLEVWSDERWHDRRALFESHAYAPIRYYDEMHRPLGGPIPAVALPAGLSFELWSAEADEEFRATHNSAFADHWGSAPLTPEEWRHHYSASPYFRPDLTVGVRDHDGSLVGYSMAYHSADDVQVTGRVEGWLGQIGVRREWRGRGVASAVMCEVMRRMLSAGFDHAGLDVDSENPTGAVGLYDRLGFRREHRWIRWAKAV